MGPLPFESGMCAKRMRRTSLRPSFNGAAPFRERNGRLHDNRLVQLMPGFNGAAPFRERNGTRLRRAPSPSNPASMGPLPFESGMIENMAAKHAVELASMGPLPFESGMSLLDWFDVSKGKGASMGPLPFESGMRASSA